MNKKGFIGNQKGFTLIEIIAVLVLLAILAAVAVPRYIDLQTEAKQRAVDGAIAELNGRETLVWSKVKMSDTGWSADTDVTNHTDYSTDLGSDFTVDASSDPKTITFKSSDSYNVTRTVSTPDSPGRWAKS